MFVTDTLGTPYAEQEWLPAFFGLGLTPVGGHTRVSDVTVDEGSMTVPGATPRYTPEFRQRLFG